MQTESDRVRQKDIYIYADSCRDTCRQRERESEDRQGEADRDRDRVNWIKTLRDS